MPPSPRPSPSIDHAIVAAAQRGEQPAREQLVRSADALITWILYRVRGCLASRIEDLKQQTWLRIFEKIDQLQDPSKFATWIGAIAASVDINDGRRRAVKHRNALSLEGQSLLDGRSVDPADRAVASERMDACAATLMALPPDEKMLIQMHYGWGFTPEDMAPVFSALRGKVVPANTVRTHLYRLLRRLREELHDYSTAPADA